MRETSAGGRFVDAAEFIEAVTSLKRAAMEAAISAKSKSRAVDELDRLVKACPTEWLGRTDVLTEIGFAYGELERFELATRYLMAALEGEGTENRATLRAVEQIANFEARLAEVEARGATSPDARERARETIENAIGRLETLLKVAQTGERLSLLGSAYKRLAVLHDTAAEVREDLVRAAECYRSAHQRALERKGFDPYPVLNWLSISALIGDLPRDVDALLQRCEVAARERWAVECDFFEAVAIPDAQLIRWLASGVPATDKTVDPVDPLVQSYRETFRWASPSARQIDSVATQIDLLATLVEKLAKGGPAKQVDAARKTVEALTHLRAGIAGEAKNERAPGAPAPDAEPEGTAKRVGAGQDTPNLSPAPHSARKPGPARKKPGRAR